MSAGFTDSEMHELRAVFNSFDADRSGTIEAGELAAILRQLNMYQSESQVRSLMNEVDTDKNGTIDFNEFLDCIAAAKSGKQSNFAIVYSRQKDVISVRSEHGATHAYSEEEMAAFSEHFNLSLAGDADVAHLLPIDASGKTIDLCRKVRDGILLAKFINIAVPGTIDVRAINLRKGNKDIDAFRMQENQTLVLNSAKSIGVKVTNIGASELIDGEKHIHIVLGLVWQLVKTHLLNSINLKNHPELIRLLEGDETLEDLLRLPPDVLLLRWFNYHLARSGSSKRVKNFSGDVKDSEAYTLLLNQIAPQTCDKNALGMNDMTQRATAVLHNAGKLGVKVFVKPRDIVAGNSRLNLIFTAAIFNQCPGLDPLSQEEIDKFGMMDDDVGDSREERAFRMWINSQGLQDHSGQDIYLHNLFEDITDGLVLLYVIDSLRPGIVDWKRKVEMKPNNKFKKLTNLNYAVELGKELGFSMVNIGGEDIYNKNKKLVLGFVWQMMRMALLQYIAKVQKAKFGNRPITDDDLINWANSKIRGAGKNSTISSFRDQSIGTGLFFIDLLRAINPRVIDDELVTPGQTPEDAMQNARYAISIARKLGATIFCLPEDVIEVRPKMVLAFIASCLALDV